MDTTMNHDPLEASGAERRTGQATEDWNDRQYAGRGPGAPIAGLFSVLWRQTATLVQDEASLAKAEISEKLTQAAVAVGAIAVGGAVLFGGFIVLLLAAVNALAPLLPPDVATWLAPAIVGLVVIVIGFIMVTVGLKAFQAKNLAPTRSMESLRRDKEMVKEHV